MSLDETLGKQITSSVALRTKLYSLLMVDGDFSESRKAAGSGFKKHVLDRVLTHERYLACLNGQENGVVRQKTFKSRGHQIYTIETERNAGSFFFFFKRGWAWLVHGRIAYECFAYLWGTAVLWEDASGINMCNQG